MNRLVHFAFLVLLLPATASGGDLELVGYASLKEISLEAADVRQDMESLMLSASTNQARIQTAEEELQLAGSEHGGGSADYALAQARLDAIRREALEETLDQLEVSERRLATAKDRTSSHVKHILKSPRAFKGLAEAQIAGRRSPEITAVLLYIAIDKLHAKCSELLSRAMVDTLESDLEEIARTIEMIGRLSGGGNQTPESLEEALAELTGGGTNPGGLDDLDRFIP